MTDTATSTIAQLLFRSRPLLDLGGLVGDLDAALNGDGADGGPEGGPNAGPRVTAGREITLDLPGARITLGFTEDLTGEYRACLSIGVGPRPGAGQRPQGAALRRRAKARRGTAVVEAETPPGGAAGPSTGAVGQDRLCRMVAARIERSFPPDRIVWHEVEGQVTPALLHRFAADLPPEATLRLPGAPARAAQPPLPPAAQGQTAAPQPRPDTACDAAADRAPTDPQRDAQAGADAAAAQSRLARLPPPPPDGGAAAAELDRMLRRLDRSLAERVAVAGRSGREDAPPEPEVMAPPSAPRAPRGTGYRPALPQVTGQRHRSAAARAAVAARFPPIEEIASGMPDLPLTAAQDPAQDQRQAEAQAAAARLAARQAMSVPLRLACHAINATVMVIALPVGAAMMTYAILRGENLTASARALAIMGMAVGLRDSPVGIQIMSML